MGGTLTLTRPSPCANVATIVGVVGLTNAGLVASRWHSFTPFATTHLQCEHLRQSGLVPGQPDLVRNFSLGHRALFDGAGLGDALAAKLRRPPDCGAGPGEGLAAVAGGFGPHVLAAAASSLGLSLRLGSGLVGVRVRVDV